MICKHCGQETDETPDAKKIVWMRVGGKSQEIAEVKTIPRERCKHPYSQKIRIVLVKDRPNENTTPTTN